MFQDFDQCFQVVMHKIEELVVDCMEMQTMIEDCMEQILQAIQNKSSGKTTPTIGNSTSQCKKILFCTMPSPDPTPEPMNIKKPNQTDGSLPTNPSASHANHTNDGYTASAGVSK